MDTGLAGQTAAVLTKAPRLSEGLSQVELTWAARVFSRCGHSESRWVSLDSNKSQLSSSFAYYHFDFVKWPVIHWDFVPWLQGILSSRMSHSLCERTPSPSSTLLWEEDALQYSAHSPSPEHQWHFLAVWLAGWPHMTHFRNDAMAQDMRSQTDSCEPVPPWRKIPPWSLSLWRLKENGWQASSLCFQDFSPPSYDSKYAGFYPIHTGRLTGSANPLLFSKPKLTAHSNRAVFLHHCLIVKVTHITRWGTEIIRVYFQTKAKISSGEFLWIGPCLLAWLCLFYMMSPLFGRCNSYCQVITTTFPHIQIC